VNWSALYERMRCLGGAGALWLAGGLLRVSMKLRRQGWILQSDLRTVLAVTAHLERLAVMLSLGRRRRKNQKVRNGLSR
jgi:hypothetical protein